MSAVQGKIRVIWEDQLLGLQTQLSAVVCGSGGALSSVIERKSKSLCLPSVQCAQELDLVIQCKETEQNIKRLS